MCSVPKPRFDAEKGKIASALFAGSIKKETTCSVFVKIALASGIRKTNICERLTLWLHLACGRQIFGTANTVFAFHV